MNAALTSPLFARITGDRVTDWLVTHGLRIVVIVAVVAVVFLVFRAVVPHVVEATVRRQMTGRPEEETSKRAKTLVNAVLRTAEVVLAIIALLMVLPELSVNIGALLAGVGIAGIAIGFGAQTLVRDTLNGLFILIENQYGIGDVVTVAGVTGRVEEVNLRRTVLRDLDGVVHSVPNSEIRVASNYTRDWSGVNMSVTVPYDADLDKVTEVIDAVGRELAADKAYKSLIKEAPHVERVDAFKDSGVSLKVLGVTKPMRQWDVMGELRRRLKKAFDSEHIEMRW
ncbi:MAG: mechanosensitive ion channel family protein [Dehalococcoidia bacterium]|nr:mechanosensitive ion channel family protein [Dehalococcoidia bacterium]